MVYARLAKRLRKLGFKTFRDYIEFIGTPAGVDELGTTLNALTTNLTKFFRENHHFEHLGTAALQEVRARAVSQGRRLRIWSAGCSSGEEPHSIAITLLQSMPDIRSEEHTSELQSLMRISYAVFCLQKKKKPYTA